MLKIDAAIRDAFTVQELAAKDLQVEVDRYLRKHKEPTWHYESRVKGIDSFALKVETGRIDSLDEIEDVFGATIVVPAWPQVTAAENLVLDKYTLEERRPPSMGTTTKGPDSFRFDDVRLYVRYRRDENEQSPIRDGTLFEIQVKTFLQHAWAVATHDVIYKTPSRDWRRERIAHQVRASLEAAEVAIGGIDTLASSPMLPETTREIVELNGIIELLQQDWPTSLPTDVRRLAENVQGLLVVASPNRTADRVATLQTLLNNGKMRNHGAHSVHWSPYRSVLNYLATDHKNALRAELKKARRKNNRRTILIYPEILGAVGLGASEAVGAVIAGS